MKMQLTKNNAYMYGTIKEIATEVYKMLQKDCVRDNHFFRFPKFAYAFANSDAGKINDLVDIARNSTGWYGMEHIKTRFDSESVAVLLADYFGGGCAVVSNLWLDEIDGSEKTTVDAISTAMKQSMEMQEHVENYTIIIAEWEMDDFILVNEVSEVCPHCDHENTFFDYEIVNEHSARCKNCGRLIFLCSECEYAQNGYCGYHEIPGGCECSMGKIVETFIKK